VSSRLAIVAGPAAAGVAGLHGTFGWGEAETVAPGGAGPAADFVVALGDAEAGGGREPDVRWRGEAGEPAGARRLVAPSGTGLWSRTLWPVHDELFDLPPAPRGAGLLLISAGGADERLVERLAERGLAPRHAPELTADGLAGAAIVVFAPTAGGGHDEALPAAAPAVLAAGRFLITPRSRLRFGLLPAVDHLPAGSDDEIVQYADALGAFPESFALQVTLGRIAAERHRASVLYGRLVAELEAERTAA
jgi:hypothetical protein